jgi:hypothetical protein
MTAACGRAEGRSHGSPVIVTVPSRQPLLFTQRADDARMRGASGAGVMYDARISYLARSAAGSQLRRV